MSPASRLRLFYFLYYGAVGANLPYLAAYLRGLGFSGEAIGTVQMLSPLVARRLPSPRPGGPHPHLADFAALARDGRLLALLLACAAHWAACAPFHLMFGVFVRDAGL